MRSSVGRNVSEEFEVSFFLLFRVHRQGFVDRFSRFGRVPRVDDQGSVQRVSCSVRGNAVSARINGREKAGRGKRGEEERTCSGKFGKDENSVSLLLACNVLVGDLLNMGEE